METFVADLQNLLASNSLPSGVATADELKAWLSNSATHLAEWATSKESVLFPASANGSLASEPKAASMGSEPNNGSIAAEPTNISISAEPAEAKESFESQESARSNNLAAPSTQSFSSCASLSPRVGAGTTEVPEEGVALDDPCLKAVWEEVRSDKNPTNWMLLGLKAGAPRGKTIVELVGRGTGGREEMVALMENSRVLFGGFRVKAIDDKTGVISERAKFVVVIWVGESMNAMAKARVSMQREGFDAIFHASHLSLQVSSEDEMTEEVVTQALHANAGAHKPSRYEY